MENNFVKKYGLRYVPTKEWIVCLNGDNNNYLFTEDENKIEVALASILYSKDGIEDIEKKDIEIDHLYMPADYDGSSLVEDPSTYFVDSSLVEANITALQSISK